MTATAAAIFAIGAPAGGLILGALIRAARGQRILP